MGSIIDKFAFRPPKCSYHKKLENLHFVRRVGKKEERLLIPVYHCHLSDFLPTVLYCHNFATDIGLYPLQMLATKLNANIISFDFAGYGLHSLKKPSEADCYLDVEAVYYQYVLPIVRNPRNVAIVGHCFGSTMAIYLASVVRNDPIKPNNLVLLSSIYSAATLFAWISLPYDKFQNYLLAPGITMKTTFYHGALDTTVPISCAKELSLKFQNLAQFHTLHNCDNKTIMQEEFLYQSMRFLVNS